MKGRLVTVALLAFVLAGCVDTSITSQMNRLAIPEPPRRVLVVGNFTDLALRDRAEERLCDDLVKKTRSECFRSMDYTPPGSNWTWEDIVEASRAIPADAVLSAAVTGTSISTVYIPPSTTTTGSASVIGSTVVGQSTTQTSGGGYITAPNAAFEFHLWTGVGDAPAWYATASAEGYGLGIHEWDDLVSATAGAAVNKLLEDRVILARSR